MRSALTSLFRPLLSAVLLGMVLGGLGSLGLFFWENREMCPCAPVGLVENAQSMIAAPAAPGELSRNMLLGSGAGAALAVLLSTIVLLPAQRRMQRLLDED